MEKEKNHVEMPTKCTFFFTRYALFIRISFAYSETRHDGIGTLSTSQIIGELLCGKTYKTYFEECE